MKLVWAAVAVLGGCATAGPTPENAPPKRDALEVWNEAEAAARVEVEPRHKASAPPFVIHNVTIMTADGTTIPRGWISVSDGLIDGMGEGAPLATTHHVIDGAGGFVTPGIVDTHSHIGVYPVPSAKAHGDGNEMVTPVTAGAWAEHSAWPQDPNLELALAGGVTMLHVIPGSGNLIGGRGITWHMTPQRGSRAMRFPGAPQTLKMACGENPKRVYGGRNQAPSTRMGNLQGQRAAFSTARAYLAALNGTVEELAKLPRDNNMDTLAGVLLGKVLVHIHCYRADDMLNMMALAREFGFQIRSFHHALEAYKIRDVLAKARISVSTWADWWGFKLEAYDGIGENVAMVSDAGGLAIVHSDSNTGIQRLNQEAAKALYAGRRAGLKITEDEALRWITANPAWALGIDDRVGTLKKGKVADLILWDKHPFSVYASASLVFVDGALRHRKGASAPGWSDFDAGQEVAP